MELTRPSRVSDPSWEAVVRHKDRLDRAWQHPVDEALVIGAAKDLCECVARVVLEERAVAYSRADDMPKLVKAAHTTLDRRPGQGQAAQIGVRNLSQAALSIVTVVYELRNELGTGHGRSRTPRISHEAAVAVSDAAMLWVRWALARLDEVLSGEVDRLVRELRVEVWTRGKLERRFDEVGLDSLFADDQQRLGVAVAERAAGGTFVVRESGIDPLLDRPGEWPEAYRLGVASGLLFAVDGSLRVLPQFVPVLASVVGQMSPPEWQRLSRQIDEAALNQYWSTTETVSAANTALEEAARELPQFAREGWQHLAGKLAGAEPRPEPAG